MKLISCSVAFFLLLLSFSLYAQSPFTGTYQGNVEGSPATCTLKQIQSQLSGQVNAIGYIYQLSGTVEGNSASGQVTDLQEQSQLPYTAQIQGDQLTFTLVFQDDWGNKQEISLNFHRGSSHSAIAAMGGHGATQDGFERDVWSRYQ